MDPNLGLEINTFALELCVDQRAHVLTGTSGIHPVPPWLDGWVRPQRLLMTDQAREARRHFVLNHEGTRWDIGNAVRFLLSD